MKTIETNLDAGIRLRTAKVGESLYRSAFFGGWPPNCRNAEYETEAEAKAGHKRLVEKAGGPLLKQATSRP